ncbi:MAG: M67 family metallopeptidase, partial [Anaerolineales bacterium]|nr:M67 family metallopeptidase [Anaerolineales bacterium]
MKLHLPSNLLQRIEQHGEHSYPDEGAGVLLGHTHQDSVKIEDVIALENNFEADQRRRRYQIDARAMMQVEIAADDRQLEIVGIFHSHPDHPARPSDYDLEHSLPWFAYIITSIEAGRAGSSRAWRLLDDRSQFEEIQIDVE